MNRWVFLAVCVLCAVSVGVVSVGLIRQGNTSADQARIGCNAANRALAAEEKVWGLVQKSVVADWKQHPPSSKERDRTAAFFASVNALLRPAKC